MYPLDQIFYFKYCRKLQSGAYNLSLNQSKPETRIPSRYVINNHVFLTSELLNKKLNILESVHATYLSGF